MTPNTQTNRRGSRPLAAEFPLRAFHTMTAWGVLPLRSPPLLLWLCPPHAASASCGSAFWVGGGRLSTDGRYRNAESIRPDRYRKEAGFLKYKPRRKAAFMQQGCLAANAPAVRPGRFSLKETPSSRFAARPANTLGEDHSSCGKAVRKAPLAFSPSLVLQEPRPRIPPKKRSEQPRAALIAHCR